MSTHTIPPRAVERRDAVLAAVRALQVRRARREASMVLPMSRRLADPRPRTWQ